MVVLVNGEWVGREQARVSAFDRGFLYGDGLFETIRLRRGKPFRWEQHLERFQRGADLLRLRVPFSAPQLRAAVDELVHRNQATDGILRLTLSRGEGPRGYSLPGAVRPCWVMTLDRLPAAESAGLQRWRLITASVRVPCGDPLTGVKSCNKLPQVLARLEAETSQADEGLLLNTDGQVAEAASANLFCIQGERLLTPPIQSGALPGITRALVLELSHAKGWSAEESPLTPEQVRQADGTFLTLSTWGIVEAISLDGHPLQTAPLTEALRSAYLEILESECA
jgi:aminodeoxychorismate lyase